MRVILPFFFTASLALAQTAPLELSLKRAVEVALSPEGNTRVQLSAESVKQAESRSAQARGALLPDVSGSVSYQSQTRNLEAVGIVIDLPIPGFQSPTFIGPFNVFDARASVQQTVFDFSAIRRYQAARTNIAVARTDSETTAEQVAAQVARAYLAALKAQVDVEVLKANVTLADAVLQQVTHQKAAGTGTGIEITRARVQLSNEQQRLLVAQNDQRRALLQLLRAAGLRLDTPVTLTGTLAYTPVDPVTIEEAKARAFDTRPDLKTQVEREDSARLTSSAVKMERLPSLAAFADYGATGTGIGHALPTRTYGVALRVPVFDGGRTRSPPRRKRLAIPRRGDPHPRPAPAGGTRRPPRTRCPALRRRPGQGLPRGPRPRRQGTRTGPAPLRSRRHQQPGSHRCPDPPRTRPRQPDLRTVQLQLARIDLAQARAPPPILQ